MTTTTVATKTAVRAAATATNTISSDSGVGIDLGIDGDDDDAKDPYAELEFYLEKVKVSVVFHFILLYGHLAECIRVCLFTVNAAVFKLC